MFIKRITISNFRLFSSESGVDIENINTPDRTHEGSGLTVFLGENGSGKTTLLDAFALPILEYKSDGFGIDNFNDPDKDMEINIYSKDEFEVAGTMPKGSFIAKGFTFEARVRMRKGGSYLSSIVVNDQKFISVDASRPKSSSPDLRVNVNNPFKGKRFTENDVLFLDRRRLYQTRTGNFNTTRFDRLMEDFSLQYIRKSDATNLNEELDEKIKKDKVENDFLAEAVEKFHELSGSRITLDFLDNYAPFKTAFFAKRRENNQQIILSNLGSGYEMIFALLYSFYLAQQSNKQLIILIDEPELHLHPRLQEKFVHFLLEFSKTAQIIIASQSPLFVKQLSYCDNVKMLVINDQQEVLGIHERVLPYVSANETNFVAFSLATEEYHNELYEELRYVNGDKGIKDFDNDFFVAQKREPKNSPWKGNPNEVTVHTLIRNQIHHQKDYGRADYDDLKASIEAMRGFF